MGIKNRISKIIKLTVFMLLAVVISASFMQIAFAKKVVKSVPSHVENYQIPGYITYEQYINDPFLLCTAKGVAIPGYGSTLVVSGGHTADTTDQGKPTGYLTINDLGSATVFAGNNYSDLVDTQSRTYGYYTDAEVHQATPAEAYILAELDQNTPGNGVEFTVTDREYTGDVYEDAYLDVDGERYYAVEYNSAHEPTKYVAKVNGKYYEVETNDTEGSGSYSAVQIAWWAVATVQEGDRVPDNSLATEARNFEEYINMLSPNGKYEIIRDGEVETSDVESISLNKTNVTLDPGKTEQLELTMLPDNLAKTDITWTTSNKNVVGIDSNGKITAKKAGTATITVAVKNNDSMKAECKVTVTGNAEENKDDKENKKQLRDENKDLNILYLGTEDKTTNQLGNSLVGFVKDYGYSGKFNRVSTNGDLTDLIGSDNWNKLDLASYDVIIIQEDENTIRTNGQEFRDAAKKIADSAKSKNSNVKLFVRQVSANKDADSNTKNSIYNTVSEAAKDIGGTVINDGKAFDESSSKNSNINLYSGNENMSNEGAYLSAACIFATVYGHNPEDVDYYGNVGESNGKKLQEIAASVCSSSIKEDDSNKEESEETTEEGENPESVDGVYEGSVSAENLFNIDYPTSMESENAEVLYDSTTNKYKIGPFKVSYLRYITKCGERPAADFSGITESLLTGKFYRDGKEVTELISTDNYRFVYEHDHAAVRAANNSVDTDASYPFPYSDEEFYIELDYLDDLASITSFKFNFHYMNGGATFTVFHGTYLTIYWKAYKTGTTSSAVTAFDNDSRNTMLAYNLKDSAKNLLKTANEKGSSVNLTEVYKEEADGKPSENEVNRLYNFEGLEGKRGIQNVKTEVTEDSIKITFKATRTDLAYILGIPDIPGVNWASYVVVNSYDLTSSSKVLDAKFEYDDNNTFTITADKEFKDLYVSGAKIDISIKFSYAIRSLPDAIYELITGDMVVARTINASISFDYLNSFENYIEYVQPTMATDANGAKLSLNGSTIELNKEGFLDPTKLYFKNGDVIGGAAPQLVANTSETATGVGKQTNGFGDETTWYVEARGSAGDMNGDEIHIKKSGILDVIVTIVSDKFTVKVHQKIDVPDFYIQEDGVDVNPNGIGLAMFYNADGKKPAGLSDDGFVTVANASSGGSAEIIRADSCGSGLCYQGKVLGIQSLATGNSNLDAGSGTDIGSLDYGPYVSIVGYFSGKVIAVKAGIALPVNAEIELTFKDSGNGADTLIVNYNGVSANVEEGDNGNEGDGADSGSGNQGGSSQDPTTVEDTGLIAQSGTQSKSQTQTTVGPGGGEPGGGGDGDYDEDDTEMGTGAAYIVDYDADIEFLEDGMELDLTTAIGGMVWEDFETFEKGEEVKANGIYNDADGDKKLSKIEVRIWKVVYEKKDDAYVEVTSGEYARTLADAYRKKTVSENGSVKLEDKIDFESDDRSKRLYTDDNGDYTAYLNVPAIEGLDTEKYKVSYDVEFIYDGQTYEVTEYLASTGETETAKKVEKFESTSATPDGAGENPNPVDYSAYANDSYAIETYDERHAFDTKFTEIYGKEDMQTDGTTKGAASNPDSENSEELELNYTSADQGFDTDPTGEADSENTTDNAETRKVSTLVTKDNDGYILNQYGMKARTSTAGLLLPYEDRIHVEDKKEDIPLEYIDTGAEGQFTYYKPINEYFSHINLGLVNRDKVDVSVSQDLYKAGITVNQDDLTYKYSALIDLENEKYADKLNMLLDMQNAGVAYEIGLYASDFYYRSDVYKASGETEITKAIYDAKKESELRLFATYKMSVYNDSDYHDISINELTDYFDSSYSLITENVSTEIENEEGVREEQIVAEPSYYRIYNPLGSDMLDSPYHYNKDEDIGENLVRVNRTEEESEPMVTGLVTWTVDEGFSQDVTAEDGTVGGTYSRMTTNTFETTTADGGKRVTNELTLRPGEKLEIFVSFEVDHDGYNLAKDEEYDETQETKDETRQDLLGDKNSVLEVSNFTSFYTEDSLRKNNNVAYKAGEVSGRVDKDSAPDNVNFSMTETLEKNGINYTILDKNWFEDDTDSAPVFRVYLRDKDQREREINGVVWEEDLNKEVEGTDNTKTGDGIFTDEEGRVPGVTVSLVEKIKLAADETNGEIPEGEYEYVWPDKAFGDAIPDYTSVTMSDEKGNYTLRNFVSGNYVVRFEYGNTAMTMDYNGQDYKNTSYQDGIVNPSQETIDENFDEDHRNNDQTDEALTEQITLNNEWHDLTGNTEGLTNSEDEKRVSDARDYEARRLGIIEFSRTIDNATAEVLAVADSKELQDLKTALAEKMFDENGNIIKNYGTALNEVLEENKTLNEFVNGTEGKPSKYKSLLEYTAMQANTAKLRVQIEDSSDLDFGTTKKSTGGAFTVNVGGSYDQILDAAKNNEDNVEKVYTIGNIDFGLERRADTIIQVDKFLKGIELQKENEPIYKVTIEDNGDVIEEYMESDKITGIDMPEANGVQGFRYINMEEEALKNTRLIIDYKVKVSNKSEVDYASSTIVNDAYTTEELNEHIKKANENLASGEYIKYGTFAGLYYYTHNTEAANGTITVAGEDYTDDAVRTTVDQLVDYIDPGIALTDVSEENAFWATADNKGTDGSTFASLNGLISDDSYTVIPGDNPKYYLQDDTGELYISESKSNVAFSNNDAIVKTQKTTPALQRGDKGEGKLAYELDTGDTKANNIGQRVLQEQPATVYNVYAYPNTYNTEYKPDVFNKDLTKELSTMNLVKEANEEKPTSAEISIKTQVDLQSSVDLDDMIYDNLAEVLAYSNSVGRRSMYAIPGNAFEIAKIEEVNTTEAAADGGIWNSGHSSNAAKDPVTATILDGLDSSETKANGYEYMQTTKYAFNTLKAIDENKSAANGFYVAELDADAANFVTFTEPTGLSKTMENQAIFIIVMLIALIVLAVGIILITLKVVMVKSTDDITIESTKE